MSPHSSAADRPTVVGTGYAVVVADVVGDVDVVAEDVGVLVVDTEVVVVIGVAISAQAVKFVGQVASSGVKAAQTLKGPAPKSTINAHGPLPESQPLHASVVVGRLTVTVIF